MTMHSIQCYSCERKAAEYLMYPHVVKKGSQDREVKICVYCNRAKSKGWVLFKKFNRWINPDVVEAIVEKSVTGLNPNKLTLEQLQKPLASYGYEVKGGLLLPAKKKKLNQVTVAERKKITEKFGKNKFNPAISNKKAKTDTWLGWDAYDYKDDDLSTLLM